MSVYKRNYKVVTKAGAIETRTQSFFTIEIRHPQTGKIVRRRGPKDRKAAKVMEANLLTELERGKVGLLDPFKLHRGVPVQTSIDAFIEKLGTEKKDEKYIYVTRKRLQRVVIECGWKNLFDATNRSFEEWRNRTSKAGKYGKPTSAKTLNQFLATLREFFKWCVQTDRMELNPLTKMVKVSEIQNDDYRRAMTVAEMGLFLNALPSEDVRRFYLFAAYTALRRATLEGLQWGDLLLDKSPPLIRVRAETYKGRRVEEFPLRRDIADLMRAARGDAGERERVFPHPPTIDDHREYLAKAGVKFDDGHGRKRIDLHAMRKTMMTWMEDAGVSVQEASKALGHRHLTTTLRSYRETRAGKPEAGVERLPSLLDNGGPNTGTPEKVSP